MPNDLFRPEVMLARRDAWLGPVAVSQPLSLRALAACSALAAILVVTFLVVATYTRRSTVVGQLVPTSGIATVLAPANGVVMWMVATEGRRVIKGERIAVVASSRVTTSGDNAFDATERLIAQRVSRLDMLSASRSQASASQATALREQVALARVELDGLETASATRNAQADIARRSWNRLRQLREDRLVSAIQVDQQEAAYLQALTDLQGVQRQALSMRRTIGQLEQALRDIDASESSQQADIDREKLALEQERLDSQVRGGMAVVSPVTGTVAATLVKPGQPVLVGQSVMSLLPAGATLEAELLVPSSAIGFVEPGNRVLLRYQAFPYQKFGHHEGRVVRISRAAIAPSELGAAAPAVGPPGERVYRVVVALPRQVVQAYGRTEPLRPGMMLQADILSERRRLVEWLFEPLHALRQRVQR